MVNAISVDLEDWYHICGIENQQWVDEWYKYSARLEKNVGKILRLFKTYQVRATFFVVGYIADKNPVLAKRIVDSGHELATHGYLHRRIFDMAPEEFEEDLVKSKRVIETVSGKRVLGYRAPEWSLKKGCEWSLDILKKNGFEYDASANPLSHRSGKHFGLYPHRIETRYGQIYEFPLSTYRLLWERLPFTGGLPLRLNPYFYILENTRLINQAGFPVIFCLHPWEFDKERTKIDLPLNRKFMHYYNYRHVPAKIELLLQQFDFTTVEEVLGLRKTEPPPQHKNRNKENKEKEKEKEKIDKAYVKSFSLTMAVFLFILIVLTSASCLMKFYAPLLIVAGLSIWYWPWGIFFKVNHD